MKFAKISTSFSAVIADISHALMHHKHVIRLYDNSCIKEKNERSWRK